MRPFPHARLLGTLLAGLILPASGLAAPFAYVPNEKSGSVSVIDTATDTVVRTLPGGKRPRGIATDGTHLYISEAPSSSLVVVNIDTARQIKSI